MSNDALRTEMRDGFKEVDRRFKKGDQRLKQADQQFVKLRSEMRNGFKKIDERFNAVDGEFDKVRAVIKAEGEKTRRHFDMMVEKMQESVKVIAEATSHHAVRLDAHETRINRLEGVRHR